MFFEVIYHFYNTRFFFQPDCAIWNKNFDLSEHLIGRNGMLLNMTDDRRLLYLISEEFSAEKLHLIAIHNI